MTSDIKVSPPLNLGNRFTLPEFAFFSPAVRLLIKDTKSLEFVS
jgi:hypothetical protein